MPACLIARGNSTGEGMGVDAGAYVFNRVRPRFHDGLLGELVQLRRGSRLDCFAGVLGGRASVFEPTWGGVFHRPHRHISKAQALRRHICIHGHWVNDDVVNGPRWLGCGGRRDPVGFTPADNYFYVARSFWRAAYVAVTVGVVPTSGEAGMTSKNFTKGDRVKTREPSSLVGVVTRTHRVFHIETTDVGEAAPSYGVVTAVFGDGDVRTYRDKELEYA